MSRVMVADATYESIHEPLTSILDTFPIHWNGKTVVLKPNALRPSPPEAAVTTSPALVRELVRLLADRGARVLVGDNPGGGGRHGDNRRVFERTGLLEAAGGSYVNFGAEPVPVSTGHPACQSVVVSRPVLDADILISLPKFKTHGLTGLTGAVKNSYGFIPGAQKGQIHVNARTPWNFAEAVVEVFAVRPPDLVIVDAVVGMQGNGPNSRDLIYVGKLIASDDAVAVDRVMAHMMGLPAHMVRTLTRAAERNLGEGNLDRIEIIGKAPVLEGFRLPPRYAGDDPSVLHETRKGGPGPAAHYPVADPDACDLCMTCIEECPAAALAPNGGIPVVNMDLCVTCYCCQELCPRAAIVAIEG